MVGITLLPSLLKAKANRRFQTYPVAHLVLILLGYVQEQFPRDHQLCVLLQQVWTVAPGQLSIKTHTLVHEHLVRRMRFLVVVDTYRYPDIRTCSLILIV